MSDFLARLARRQVEPAPTLLPRTVSRFAPVDPVAAVTAPEVESTMVPRPYPDGRSHGARGEAGDAGADGVRAGALEVVGQTSHADGPAAAPLIPAPRVSRRSPERPLQEDAVHGQRPLAEAHDAASRHGRDDAPSRGENDARRDTSATPEDGASAFVPLVPNDVAAARRASDRTARERAAGTPFTTAGRGAHVSVARDTLDTKGEGREEPVVHVTIGRVEVRAMVQPPAAREERAAPRPGALSLEQYLEQRHGTRR